MNIHFSSWRLLLRKRRAYFSKRRAYFFKRRARLPRKWHLGKLYKYAIGERLTPGASSAGCFPVVCLWFLTRISTNETWIFQKWRINEVFAFNSWIFITRFSAFLKETSDSHSQLEVMRRATWAMHPYAAMLSLLRDYLIWDRMPAPGITLHSNYV